MDNQYNPDLHHRRSIRLQGYDYRQAGAYFVTICTQGRMCLFGDIVGDAMRWNDAGRMVQSVWLSLPTRFPKVMLDAFVVMPNHLHGIVVLNDEIVLPAPSEGEYKIRPYETAANCRGEPCVRPDTSTHNNRPNGTQSGTLSRIIQAFKSTTTHAYIQGISQHGWLPFTGRLWQRNYYDHIIRNEAALDHIRDYIMNNPLRWELDQLHPGNPSQW